MNILNGEIFLVAICPHHMTHRKQQVAAHHLEMIASETLSLPQSSASTRETREHSSHEMKNWHSMSPSNLRIRLFKVSQPFIKMEAPHLGNIHNVFSVRERPAAQVLREFLSYYGVEKKNEVSRSFLVFEKLT